MAFGLRDRLTDTRRNSAQSARLRRRRTERRHDPARLLAETRFLASMLARIVTALLLLLLLLALVSGQPSHALSDAKWFGSLKDGEVTCSNVGCPCLSRCRYGGAESRLPGGAAMSDLRDLYVLMARAVCLIACWYHSTHVLVSLPQVQGAGHRSQRRCHHRRSHNLLEQCYSNDVDQPHRLHPMDPLFRFFGRAGLQFSPGLQMV